MMHFSDAARIALCSWTLHDWSRNASELVFGISGFETIEKHPLIALWLDVFSFLCGLEAFSVPQRFIQAEVTELPIPGVMRTRTDSAGFC